VEGEEKERRGRRLEPEITKTKTKTKSATAPPKPYFHPSPRQLLRPPRAKGLRDKENQPEMPERKHAGAGIGGYFAFGH
jgi:hypothetical protein